MREFRESTNASVEAYSEATGLGSSVSAPSVTTAGSDRLILCYYTNKKNSKYTPAPGTSEVYDDPNDTDGQPSNMLATYVQDVEGATEVKTATSTEPECWVAQQISVRSNLALLPAGFTSFTASSNASSIWSADAYTLDHHLSCFHPSYCR